MQCAKPVTVALVFLLVLVCCDTAQAKAWWAVLCCLPLVSCNLLSVPGELCFVVCPWWTLLFGLCELYFVVCLWSPLFGLNFSPTWASSRPENIPHWSWLCDRGVEATCHRRWSQGHWLPCGEVRGDQRRVGQGGGCQVVRHCLQGHRSEGWGGILLLRLRQEPGWLWRTLWDWNRLQTQEARRYIGMVVVVFDRQNGL